MIFYKSAEIINWQQYNTALSKFIDLSKFDNGNYSYTVEPSDIDLACPGLFNKIESIVNDQIYITRFFVTVPNGSTPIHIDGSKQWPKFMALNWPLMGTKDTWMNWYDAQPISSDVFIERYGDSSLFDPTSAKLLDKLELIEPTIVRINVPHSVVNTNSTRVILSIRFCNELKHITL